MADRRDDLSRCRFRARPVDRPDLGPQRHWQADLHDPEAGAFGPLPYPVATAWLTEFPPDSCLAGMCLDFVLVPDGLRRRGYGRELVRRCDQTWPGLWLTEAVSSAGERLAESLERDLGDADG